MKIERFVKEYAVHARERGIITVDETLRVIMDASRFRNAI